MSFIEDTLAAPRPDALEEAASTPANLPIPTTLNSAAPTLRTCAISRSRQNADARARTLSFLARTYTYWIALTDCDGFRIDTVWATS
jgi:hypothetical protein